MQTISRRVRTRGGDNMSNRKGAMPPINIEEGKNKRPKTRASSGKGRGRGSFKNTQRKPIARKRSSMDRARMIHR